MNEFINFFSTYPPMIGVMFVAIFLLFPLIVGYCRNNTTTTVFATKFSKSRTTHRIVMVDGQKPSVSSMLVDYSTSISMDILNSAPKAEIGNYIVYFVPLTQAHSMDSYEQFSDECERNGFEMVNPHILLKTNADDPSFTDRCPNLTMWKNTLGHWCYIAFYKSKEGGRWAHSGYLAKKWFNGDGWHIAVVLKRK
jgi:hypothetical protein